MTGLGDNEQTPALPEDMIETLARAFAEEEAELTGTESFRIEARHRETATTVLAAALAGRTVLELPAPVRHDPSMWEAADGIEPYWRVDPDLDESGPLVRCQLGDRYMDSGDAFRLGLALIAGAREAERLASESSGDGENDAE